MNNLFLNVFFLLFFISSNLFSLNDSFSEGARGQIVFPVLKDCVSPYFHSMGCSGSAILREDNIYLNPASLYSHNSRSVSVSFHKTNVDSTRSDLYFISRDADFLNGFSFSYIDYGSFLKIDENAEVKGEFSPYDLMLSYSHGFGKNERFGFKVKYIESNMVYEKARGFAVDLGFLIRGKQNLVSLLARNIGPSVNIGKKYYRLPFDLSAGFAYIYSNNLRGVFDFVFPSYNKTYATAGFEYIFSYTDMDLSLRGGINTVNFREIGWGGIFAAGFGIYYNGFGIDYSFTPVSNIDSVHRVMLHYSFGEVKYKKEEKYRFKEFIAKEISLKKKIAVFSFVSDNKPYADVVANAIEKRLIDKKHSVISRLDPIYISNSKNIYGSDSDVISSARLMGADYAVWGVITKVDEIKSEFKVIVISIKDGQKYIYSIISSIYDIGNISLKISDEVSRFIS